ncbi:hypothetical protein [Actinomadura sp. 7K507]|uniref:NucA/NucB deoxyribonuclease domain-containing protein n=1 Tax=Actinomadura sp. 7K507 TaxID=2530365 RepID=UPI001053831C|nr:hypothetical protein [Actinomadura sp. 7K507]TDC97728.1 hypothetical protein E1285_02575 [Actinomadura sp. 7K507]
MRFAQARNTTVVAVAVTCLALVLSAFTPGPPSSGTPGQQKVHPRVQEWADGLPNAKQEPGPKKCTTKQDEKGQETTLCLEKVDPEEAPPLPPMPRTADPVPPSMCYVKPGQVNYDRFNACQQSTLKVTVNSGSGELGGYVWWGVWETLDAKSRSWKMNFGIRPYEWDALLIHADPVAAVATQCTGNCDTPDPEQKNLGVNNEYLYFGEQDVASPGDGINYSNPWVGLALQFDEDVVNWPHFVSWDDLTTPINIRCDSESYIGSNGGCVHYMGHSAIPIYNIDYNGPYAEVAKNALYGMTVQDPVYHYGNIQYGNPLTRAAPRDIPPHRNSICTKSIKAKATALGLTCDEWPYAASEQGGSGNPRFSCAFVPGDQNSNQGSDLTNHFFVPNRILPADDEADPYVPGDAFWVWVTNAPANPPPVKQCNTY